MDSPSRIARFELPATVMTRTRFPDCRGTTNVCSRLTNNQVRESRPLCHLLPKPAERPAAWTGMPVGRRHLRPENRRCGSTLPRVPSTGARRRRRPLDLGLTRGWPATDQEAALGSLGAGSGIRRILVSAPDLTHEDTMACIFNRGVRSTCAATVSFRFYSSA